jgi:sugar phosphate isomerase/epimerase
VLIACHAGAITTLPLEQAAGTIARLGFRAIDLGTARTSTPPAPPNTHNAEANRDPGVAGALNLTLTDLYIMLPQINAPEPEQRETAWSYSSSWFPFALALGTPGITISPGIVHKDGHEHSLARSVPALLRMLDAVDDTDLRISFEPHIGLGRAAPGRRAVAARRRARLQPDALNPAHFTCQGIVWREVAPLLEHVAHVHIRQAARSQLQTAHEPAQ